MIAEYTNVLRSYAVFNGRAGRSEFWWFVLAQAVIAIAASILSSVIYEGIFLLWFLYFFGTLLPSLAVCVRRLHDTGRGAWWLLVGTVPTLIAFPLVVAGLSFLAFGLAGGLVGGLAYGLAEVLGGGGSADPALEVFWGFVLLGLALTGIGAIGMIAAAISLIILIVYLASPGEAGHNRYGPQPT